MKSLLILGFSLFNLSHLILNATSLGIKNDDDQLFFNIPKQQLNTLLAQDNSVDSTVISPLVRAGKALLNLKAYELESTMKITGDIPGTSFVSDAKIKTIVEGPNKFNSHIIFVSPQGLEGKSYDIISDGNQVWIYNFATNQYSISDVQQFLQTREGFLLGTLSYFYINTRSNIGSSSIIANFLAKLPEDRLLKYFQRFSKLDLQNSIIREETISGKTYQAYDIDATNRGFQATVLIDPEQENIERIHLSGSKNGLQLSSKEQITHQTILESSATETFTFIPPDNAEQIEQQISITPF